MTLPEMRRHTLHTAEAVILRTGRRHLNHGVPRCKAPPFPGSTTTIDAGVTCAKCQELLATQKQEGK